MGKKKKLGWWARMSMGLQIIAEAYLVAPQVLAAYDKMLEAEKAGKALDAAYVPMARKAMKPWRELAQELLGVE